MNAPEVMPLAFPSFAMAKSNSRCRSGNRFNVLANKFSYEKILLFIAVCYFSDKLCTLFFSVAEIV